MTRPPHELDELEQAFHQGRLGDFEPRHLLWLAALPEWPDELARSIGFEHTDMAEKLAAAGLVERRNALTSDGEVASIWWLRASGRAEVGRYLRGLPRSVPLEEQLRELARMLEAADPPAAVREWLRFVAEHLRPPAGLGLIGEIDDLLAAGDATGALELVAVAQALGDLLGEPLLSAARRAQWRIDRGYREAHDARTLTYYLPRPDVEDAFDELVSGAVWAVHLLGDGGVGKTMAVRDLASGRFAARRGRPSAFPVARIDFDHLDPRYPLRKPGELLLALSGELTAYTSTRSAQQASRLVEDTIASLHEQLRAPDGPAELGLPALMPAIEAFADYLSELDAPVILVLDTCEELAKLHRPGGRAPAVDMTFELLERIHHLAPGMRALLAGRRWLTPPPEDRLSAGLVLSERPYLRVVPVGGFTRTLAERYFDLRDPRHVVPDDLRAAVLSRATRPGGAEINPFDLASYCEWALEEPGLDAERLRTASGDPYVQQRIIDRVTTASVRDCLPAAAELGRFDLPMIEPYLLRRGIDPHTAMSGLIGQEWVSTVTFDAAGNPRVIEIDAQLLPRLRAAIAADPVRFPLDRQQLGRDLVDLMAATPVEEMVVEAVEGALRLLPLDEAATLWRQLEERVCEADAWGWASQAVPRAAAVESARTSEHTILAAILATQAASVLRLPGKPGLGALWEEVVRLAPRHPAADQALWLEYRGLCGFLAADESVHSRHPEFGGRALALWRRLPGRLRRGPMIAVVDANSLRRGGLSGRSPEIRDSLCQAPEPEIAVTALLVRAADELTRDDVRGAVADVRAALRLARPGRTRRWLDWVPAPRLRDRARLARVVIASSLGKPELPESGDWCEEALPHVADIDSERLVAATLGHSLQWRLVDRDLLVRCLAYDDYVPERQPVHRFHLYSLPLSVIAAMALGAGGELPSALNAVRRLRQQAMSSSEDPLTVVDCDEGVVALCRMYRISDSDGAVRRLADAHMWERTAQMSAALALVEGECPATPEGFGEWRAWWQAQILSPDRSASTLLAFPPDDLAPLVDWAEYQAVTGARRVDVRAGSLMDYLHELLVAPRNVPRLPELIALVLRTEAMIGEHLFEVDAFIETVPTRQAAETALAEGELLALRLPDRAVLLLERAIALFERCGDLDAAYRASLLRVLTMHRAGLDLGAVRLGPAPAELVWSGWTDREALARGLIEGKPRALPSDPRRDEPPKSPELAGIPVLRQDEVSLRRAEAREAFRTLLLVLLAVVAIGVSTMLWLPLAEAGMVTGGLLALWILPQSRFYWTQWRSLLGERRRRRRESEAAPAEFEFEQQTVGHDIVGPGWWACSVTMRSGDTALSVHGKGEQVSKVASPALHRLADELFVSSRPYVVVPINLADDEFRDPWEQDLGRVTSSVRGKMPLWVRFRNRVPGTAEWNVVLRSTPSWPGDGQYTGPASLRPAPLDLSETCALFLIGTPVFTSAGWHMRVEDADGVSSADPYRKTGRGTYSGERLVAPREVGQASATLVVLQLAPVEGDPQPLGRFREGMCGLAREFLDLGFTVMVVPALPDDLAAHVVAMVAGSKRRLTNAARVLDLYHDVRAAIMAREIVASAQDERASLDVLLMI